MAKIGMCSIAYSEPPPVSILPQFLNNNTNAVVKYNGDAIIIQYLVKVIQQESTAHHLAQIMEIATVMWHVQSRLSDKYGAGLVTHP